MSNSIPELEGLRVTVDDVKFMPQLQASEDRPTAQTFFCKSGGGQEEGGMDGFMSR
jgi:hypothetical protein